MGNGMSIISKYNDEYLDIIEKENELYLITYPAPNYDWSYVHNHSSLLNIKFKKYMFSHNANVNEKVKLNNYETITQETLNLRYIRDILDDSEENNDYFKIISSNNLYLTVSAGGNDFNYLYWDIDLNDDRQKFKMKYPLRNIINEEDIPKDNNIYILVAIIIVSVYLYVK